MTDDKRDARRAAKHRRRAAHDAGGPTKVAAAARSVTRCVQDCADVFGTAPVLSGYLPIHSEIDPRPAMAAHPGPVCVPVVQGAGHALQFHRWTPDTELVEGPFGAMVPAQAALLVPQILLVPLLAFDERGYRLGYGGGFYDRTLAGLRAAGPVLAIGLAYGAQEQPRVPTEPTDQPLDLIVTESGVRRPAPAG